MRGSSPVAVLQTLIYAEERQRLFAALSGDHNPMHVDAVAARRTIMGQRVVHGIQQVLYGLEGFLGWRAGQGLPAVSIAGFTALFLKPVSVGQSAELSIVEAGDESCRLVWKTEETVLTKITIRLGAAVHPVDQPLPVVPDDPVTELSLDEIKDRAGGLLLGMDAALARQLFPLTTTSLGTLALAETLGLTRLVGMHCPGLHSIFGQATVRYGELSKKKSLDYRVASVDERFNRVVLAVTGPTVQGELITFFRPPPVIQTAMVDVKKLVEPAAFADSVALIVGGSRGLGEITAKIIAAGGGLSVITYHQGKDDAEKVVREIQAQGGRCESLQLDVLNNPEAITAVTNRAFTSLYYFATPRIPGRQRGFFDHAMLRDQSDYYVHAFGRLIDAVAAGCPRKLRVFYPSSIFVTEPVAGMEEYIMAKRLGEDLCAFYNANSKKIEITVERLPRVRTDQTSALTGQACEDPLGAMLPIVRRMERSSRE